MKKIVNPGKTNAGELFCKIVFDEETGRLSITGVEGPTQWGDCRGSAGQCQERLSDIVNYAPGWDEKLVGQFQKVWND